MLVIMCKLSLSSRNKVKMNVIVPDINKTRTTGFSSTANKFIQDNGSEITPDDVMHFEESLLPGSRWDIDLESSVCVIFAERSWEQSFSISFFFLSFFPLWQGDGFGIRSAWN